jgi:hypothetical protein
VAFKIESQLASRIMIRTILIFCIQGALVQKIITSKYMYVLDPLQMDGSVVEEAKKKML